MTNLANLPPRGQKEEKEPPDPHYIGLVKCLPCAVCGASPPSDAHHVICDRYGNRRTADSRAIPLCKKHHQWGPDAIHNGKESWVAKFGKDTEYTKETQRRVAALEDDLLGSWF